MRRLFLRLGEYMEEGGMLSKKEDVFFLTKAEVEEATRGTVPSAYCQALVTTRKREFDRLVRDFRAAPAWAYPPFLQDNRPLPLGTQAKTAQLSGRGVSPGLARGRVVPSCDEEQHG